MLLLTILKLLRVLKNERFLSLNPNAAPFLEWAVAFIGQPRHLPFGRFVTMINAWLSMLGFEVPSFTGPCTWFFSNREI